ncbi:hypothetical protein Bbelb_322310 [Branchiostoma belcheri]|nr:hypothetical protein Bbelb_322310 [Branchiostoma belcheri]
MPLRYQCAHFGVKCDFNYSKKKVISQTSIRHPNHEIARTRNQSLETLRAHNTHLLRHRPDEQNKADARPTPEPDRDRPGLHPRRAPAGRSVLIHGPTWLSGGSRRPSRHGEFF